MNINPCKCSFVSRMQTVIHVKISSKLFWEIWTLGVQKAYFAGSDLWYTVNSLMFARDLFGDSNLWYTVNSLMIARDLFGDFRNHIKIAKY